MTHRAAARAAIFSQLALLIAACTPMGNSSPASSSTATSGSTLTAAQNAGGWRPLFDGTSTDAWRGYKSQTLPAGWRIADGVLTKTGSAEDLVTRDQFGNFELAFDWKLAPGGNAGIFYRGTEEYDHIYWTAPEYQLLDNIKADDNKTPLTRAAAVYALYPAPDGHVKPVGEWNQARIVAKGNHVEHWLNGFLMEQYELFSPDWEAKVQASKFKDWPHYGRSPRGHIALQGDHNGELAFRNIRIRELP